jgi:hypothetical protein
MWNEEIFDFFKIFDQYESLGRARKKKQQMPP